MFGLNSTLNRPSLIRPFGLAPFWSLVSCYKNEHFLWNCRLLYSQKRVWLCCSRDLCRFLNKMLFVNRPADTHSRSYANAVLVGICSKPSSDVLSTTTTLSCEPAIPITPSLVVASSKAWQSSAAAQNTTNTLEIVRAISHLISPPITHVEAPKRSDAPAAINADTTTEERGRARTARPDWKGSGAAAAASDPRDFLPAKSVNPLTGEPFRKPSSPITSPTKNSRPLISLASPQQIQNHLILQQARIAKIQRVKHEVLEALRRVPAQGGPSPPHTLKLMELDPNRPLLRIQTTFSPPFKPSPPPPLSGSRAIPMPMPKRKKAIEYTIPRQPLTYEHSQYIMVRAIEQRRKQSGKPDFYGRAKSLHRRMACVRKPSPAFSVKGCKGRGDMAERLAGPSPLRCSWGWDDVEA